jgi:hypothetical protein
LGLQGDSSQIFLFRRQANWIRHYSSTFIQTDVAEVTGFESQDELDTTKCNASDCDIIAKVLEELVSDQLTFAQQMGKSSRNSPLLPLNKAVKMYGKTSM